MYRVSFSKPGCEYSRSFDTATERDKFADNMRKAGYRVTTWEV